MQVVLLQILLWILRIILFLLLLIIALVAIVMIVPIRYQVEGELHEKKPGMRGKITWFFYLVNMKFAYEEEFHIIVRIFGFKVYDSLGEKKPVKKKKVNKTKENVESNDIVKVNSSGNIAIKENIVEGPIGSTSSEPAVDNNNVEKVNTEEDELTAWEREVEALEKEEAELAQKVIQEQKKSGKIFGSKNQERILKSSLHKDKKSKKSLDEIIEDLKIKIQNIVQKVKDIIEKIQDGQLKVEHYLELWNRKETQITFQRAKKKLGKVLKAILPRKWILNGNIGFSDPATTGKLMGVLGALYPVLGNNVQVVPDFENEVLEADGEVKGHIRLGNLLYQLISLLLNRHCFKFIKLVFDELGASKKRKKEI